MLNVIILCMFIASLSFPAFAYLDGGTGSIIAQMLVGGAAGAMVVVKIYWHKFKAFFTFGKGQEDNVTTEESQSSE